MKLRLFALRDSTTNKIVPGQFFPDKQAAKQARNENNAAAGYARYVVTNGPDHRRYKA